MFFGPIQQKHDTMPGTRAAWNCTALQSLYGLCMPSLVRYFGPTATSNGQRGTDAIAEHNTPPTGRFACDVPAMIRVQPGCPVMLTENITPELGLSQFTTGCLHSLLLLPGASFANMHRRSRCSSSVESYCDLFLLLAFQGEILAAFNDHKEARLARLSEITLQ